MIVLAIGIGAVAWLGAAGLIWGCFRVAARADRRAC